jgi:hypothetical protein
MKKTILTVLIFLTLLVSACSSQPPATETAAPVVKQDAQSPTQPAPETTQEPARPPSATLNTDYENAVSVSMQLLLGTIQLEGTTNAVTKEQTAALIPLWTNFKSLSESMRPAQGEPGQQGQPNATSQAADSGLQTQLDEIIEQIQSAMTMEQVQAIAAMQITQETSRAIMEEQGITMGGPQQGGGQPPAGGGDMPQGTPPDGGGQPPAGGEGQMGTPPDGAQPGGMGGFLPAELIDALLELLTQKAAT